MNLNAAQPEVDDMETGTEGANGKTRKVRGRKDAEKQEKVIECDVIREEIDKLVRLHTAQADAAEDFNEAIKKAAEKAGLQASVVRKFVVARAGENFADKKRDIEQLSLLFEEVGE